MFRQGKPKKGTIRYGSFEALPSPNSKRYQLLALTGVPFPENQDQSEQILTNLSTNTTPKQLYLYNYKGEAAGANL